VNENSGHWLDGVWYSNGSYCKLKPVTKIAWSKPSKTYSQEDLLTDLDIAYDNVDFPNCVMCDEPAVYEDICYYCATCQLCNMEEMHCECHIASKIHSLTDEEYKKGQLPL
jgi:hypothetical protein